MNSFIDSIHIMQDDHLKRKLHDLMKSKGIQPTSQRIEIAYAIHQKKQHFTISQINETINGNDSKVSRASLFNSLNLFIKADLVKEIQINTNEAIYDSNMDQHHHIYNLDKKKFIDINIDLKDEKKIWDILVKNIDPNKYKNLKLKDFKILVQANERN